jgi:hypothetical protein
VRGWSEVLIPCHSQSVSFLFPQKIPTYNSLHLAGRKVPWHRKKKPSSSTHQFIDDTAIPFQARLSKYNASQNSRLEKQHVGISDPSGGSSLKVRDCRKLRIKNRIIFLSFWLSRIAGHAGSSCGMLISSLCQTRGRLVESARDLIRGE